MRSSEVDQSGLIVAERSPPSSGTAAAIAWLGMQSIASRLIAVIAQLVLAKLLSPKVFGLAGIALSISAIATTICGFGLDLVLQSRGDRIKYWYRSVILVFSTALIFGCGVILSVAFILLSEAKSELAILLLIVILALPASVFVVLPQAILQNSYKFRFLAIYNAGEQVSSQVMAIALALVGFRAIALILPFVVFSNIRLIVFWCVSGLKSLKSTGGSLKRPILKAGALSLGSRLSSTAIDQGDYLMIGFFSGPEQVGLYYFAFRLSSQAMRMLASSAVNVLLPTFVHSARKNGDDLSLAFQASRLLAFISFPLCFLQACEADFFIRAFFGQRWNGAAFYIEVLSFGLAFDAMAWPASAFLISKSKYRQSLIISATYCALFYLMTLIAGRSLSAVGVGLAVGLYYALHGLSYVWLIYRQFGASAFSVVEIYAKPFIFSLISFGLGRSAACTLVGGDLPLLSVVVAGSVFCCVYGLLSAWLLPQYADILKRKFSNSLASLNPGR